MDLPVIEPPIFPRWVWIEEITYSHIPIATLITALMTVAPVFEYIGYKKNDPRYDRLARSFINFSLILFSPGAALGTGIPMWIMGTYPEFWSRWSNLFFWPLIAQFGFFIGEVVFLFFLYYLTWDRFQAKKRLHIFFGCVAAIFGLLVQIVWDALGSYMLTPGAVALPGVDEPVAWSAQAFFNPSFPFLFSHRFFGNISYVMLLTGGVFAIRSLWIKDTEERGYYNFVARLTFTIGFFAFFAMPFIGWGYAGVIKEHAPVAFHAIMGGHVSPNFMVKMSFKSLSGISLASSHPVDSRRAHDLAPGLHLSAGWFSALFVAGCQKNIHPGADPAMVHVCSRHRGICRLSDRRFCAGAQQKSLYRVQGDCQTRGY